MINYDEPYRYRQFSIPSYMMDGIERWIEKGIAPGGFLSAVIKNDLSGACGRADDNNLGNLPAYCSFFYNKAPADCWGSVEKFKSWQERGGMQGKIEDGTCEINDPKWCDCPLCLPEKD